MSGLDDLCKQYSDRFAAKAIGDGPMSRERTATLLRLGPRTIEDVEAVRTACCAALSNAIRETEPREIQRHLTEMSRWLNWLETCALILKHEKLCRSAEAPFALSSIGEWLELNLKGSTG